MKCLENLTEVISEWNLSQKIAGVGIDFNKITENGSTQTITFSDEEGVEHSYEFPISNFD